MYWLGKEIKEGQWLEEASWAELTSKKYAFYKISLDAILSFLSNFSLKWKEGEELFEKAVGPLMNESGLSGEEVRATLRLLPDLLSQSSLGSRVKAEFGHQDVLDRFTKISHFPGKVRAVPAGILLHVTAGNVFLSSIDSLIMGFLTKNISVLKVSGQNLFFPQYFAHALADFDEAGLLRDKFAIVYWKGGDEAIENKIKNKVDTIVAWGGEEMIESYRKDLSSRVKLLDFGPRISLQVISRQGIKNKNLSIVARKVAEDILPWNQGACASPQNLYLQEGIDEKSLLNEIHEYLSSRSALELSDDEATEILKEKYRSYYSEIMEGGKSLIGDNHLLHLESNSYLRPSPLFRSLIIKRFKDEADLARHLSPFAYYLQSCSYLLGEHERSLYLDELAFIGIKRFAPLGTITWGMDGAPHDGRFVLRELVKFIGDEYRMQDFGETNPTILRSDKLKEEFEQRTHPRGYIFSSGGTTGEPKFLHYSYEEFDATTDMLAHNFRAQGLLPGMTVANLFVAGNLWSSFIAVEKALQKIGVIQLPIGGLCPAENIISYLQKFKPQVVLGIPSLLVSYAEFALKKGIELNIEKVFYAGEALSESRQTFLRQCWDTKYFGSGGYASVDAGIIGYQCQHCAAGEHHVFSQFIDLKIINDEIIVSSSLRDSLPVINYGTGDRGEWIGPCACGSQDPRFKLKGRIDNLIQIWSCRLLLDDFERALKETHPQILTYQLQVTERPSTLGPQEILNIFLEAKSHDFNQTKLLDSIYQLSRDLHDTLSFEQFQDKVVLKLVNKDEIPKNPRTGKISLIQDLRK
jgi:phenylacetate-CoA ligase